MAVLERRHGASGVVTRTFPRSLVRVLGISVARKRSLSSVRRTESEDRREDWDSRSCGM